MNNTDWRYPHFTDQNLSLRWLSVDPSNLHNDAMAMTFSFFIPPWYHKEKILPGSNQWGDKFGCLWRDALMAGCCGGRSSNASSRTESSPKCLSWGGKRSRAWKMAGCNWAAPPKAFGKSHHQWYSGHRVLRRVQHTLPSQQVSFSETDRKLGTSSPRSWF